MMNFLVLHIIGTRYLHRTVLANVVNMIGMYMYLILRCSHRGSCRLTSSLTQQTKAY